jgi:hypothetical protein
MDNAKDLGSQIQFKKCNSCRENLPYDQFGELASSPDGYRPTCKGCTKTIRARHYQQSKLGFPNRIEARIPLRSGNASTLDSVIAGSFIGSYFLSAKGVNDRLDYSLSVVFDKDKWQAEILDSEGGIMRRYEAWSNMDWASFSKGFLDALYEFEIRLEK